MDAQPPQKKSKEGEDNKQPQEASQEKSPQQQQQQEGWAGPFHFVALADPQLGTLKANKSWDEELDMLRKAIDHINRLQPAFVVVLGDLVNAWPEKSEESAKTQARQVDDFRDAMAAVSDDIPVFYVSGNHDLGNKLTEHGLKLFRDRFGPDYFKFTLRGVRGVVLNTQAFDDEDASELAEKQVAFLEEALSVDAHEGSEGDAKDAPKITQKIVFGHISPFLFEEHEPDGYFNLAPPIRSRLLGIAKKEGVRLWMSGHYHRNAAGRAGDLEAVTTSAVGTTLHPNGKDPLGLDGFDDFLCGEQYSGLRIVRVYEDRIEHSWHTLDSVPHQVSL